MAAENPESSTTFISDFSEEIWYQTYKYHTDNNVGDTHQRIANDLASEEVEQEKWANLFYEALSDFKVVPGGRISSNAGTNLHGATYINCFVDGPVVSDKDSIEGIFNALTRAALTLKSEGGYGFCADFIRPRGTFINGVGVETPGAVEMLRMWDTMSDVITKGSGQKKKTKKGKNKIRKGAMMVTMSCWHPDIEEFITAKQTSGQLSKFNMSVLNTDEFMDAIENHKPWELVYPDTTYENYKAEWDGNLAAWREKGYPVIVYKTLEDANELWDLIMQSTYNRNEPGVLFVDRMNQLNNLKYVEHISATNPCVAEGTLVNTPSGYRKVEEIKVGDMVSTVRGAEAVDTIETHKDIDVFKVRFSDGGEEIVTAAHRYHAIRSKTNHKRYEDIRLDELKVGDSVRVAPSSLIHGTEQDYLIGRQIGVLLGDGCYSPKTIFKNIVKIASNVDDVEYNNKLKAIFGGESNFNKDDVSSNSKSMSLILKNGIQLINALNLTPALAHEKDFDISKVTTESMAIGILDGLMATDSNINLKTNHPQIRIFTSSAKLAQTIRRLFLAIGAHAKISTSFNDDGGEINGRKIIRRHPKHSIVVNSSSLIPVIKKSRLIELHPEKGEKLQSIQDMCALTGGNWRANIVSIEPAGKACVYDLYCSGSDTWITSGYVQRGCGEQILPVGGVCLLGSLNLTQFVNEKRTDWDYEKLAKYIPIFVRMLDNVNDRTLVPLPEQRWNLQNKRRIGIGYLGYGSALYLMKIRYGSNKALKLTDRLASFVTNECYKASALLAKEKGAFPLYNQEEYLKSNFIAQALNADTIELIKQYGIRNSHLTSIQPTGNSSVYANNISGGLEPVVSAEYYRTVVVPVPPDGLSMPRINWEGRTYQIDGDTKWEWVKEGDESVLITKFNGDVYKIDKNRGLTRENLVEDYAVHVLKKLNEWDENAEWAANIFNLTIREHVDTMQAFAKYIDAAMSKCVAEGTLINTSDGIFRIEDLGEKKSADVFSKPISDDLFVVDENGNNKKIVSHYYGGKKPCKLVRFNNGYELTATYVHKLKTQHGWKCIDELSVGDMVFYRKDPLICNVETRFLPEVIWENKSKRYNFKTIVDEEFALFLGMWLADGFTNKNSIGIVEKDETVKDKIIELMTNIFGVAPKISVDKRTGVRTHYVNSRVLANYFRRNFGASSLTKKIPDEILRSSHSVWKAFLSGLTLDGFLHDGHLMIYNGYSKNICEGIKCMLSGLGVESCMISKDVPSGRESNISWGVIAYLEDKIIYPIEEHKRDFSIAGKKQRSIWVPHAERERLISSCERSVEGSWRRRNLRNSFEKNGFLREETALASGADVDYNLTCIKITHIEDVGEKDVYDIEVEDTHSYLLSGLVSHNTINLPKDYPYDDFKNLYKAMYDSKVIKGGTTYREGTMTNVISTTSTSESMNAPSGIVKNSAPKRPLELECDVHHLTVGGERWVVFIGLYEGLPYEVFAGLMDNVHLGKKVKDGKIIKHGRNKYGFLSEDVEIRDINAAFNNAAQNAITRLVSMSLRHGVDIKFIASQLQKTGNGLNTFAKCLARTLKKYINEGEGLPDVACAQCGAKTIIMMEGCNKCLTCGASACA